VLPTERIAHLGTGLLRCGISVRPMTASGQILPPRNVRGMFVIPLKAAVKADIFVRPVRATS
jgi:hypothetical protein